MSLNIKKRKAIFDETNIREKKDERKIEDDNVQQQKAI